MNRLDTLMQKAEDALSSASPSSVYQFVQFLDNEYSRHRYADLFATYLAVHSPSPEWAGAALAAINALSLSRSLQLHTHYRRLLAAACCTRQLHDEARYWQKRGLQQPLWLSAFTNSTQHTDSFWFSQWCLALTEVQQHGDRGQLTQLLTSAQRHHYWWFANHTALPPTWLLGSLLIHRDSQKEAYLLGVDGRSWLCAPVDAPDTTVRVAPEQQMGWELQAGPSKLRHGLQQLQYHRGLTSPPEEHNFTAPKALLNAIKRYAQGSGALAPVIRHIQQRPLLADSLRQATIQQRIRANDPNRMALKHIYLWLGAKKASVVLATASLQHQFMQQRVPLHQSLMQRLSLHTELLQGLAKRSKQRLPTPASLLSLLSGADLFRQPQLLQSAKWPFPTTLKHCGNCAWIANGSEENRLTTQLIKRWQLERSLGALVKPPTNRLTKLQALLILANIGVAQVYQPELSMTDDVRVRFRQALEVLQLSERDYLITRQKSAQRCHSYSPLTELSIH